MGQYALLFGSGTISQRVQHACYGQGINGAQGLPLKTSPPQRLKPP